LRPDKNPRTQANSTAPKINLLHCVCGIFSSALRSPPVLLANCARGGRPGASLTISHAECAEREKFKFLAGRDRTTVGADSWVFSAAAASSAAERPNSVEFRCLRKRKGLNGQGGKQALLMRT